MGEARTFAPGAFADPAVHERLGARELAVADLKVDVQRPQ